MIGRVRKGPGDFTITERSSFAAGNWVSVGPSSSMRIKGHPGAKAPVKDAGSFEVVNNFLKLKSSEGTSSISGLRSGDKASALVPVAPVQTRVRDARPTFTWKIDDPSLELRFTVYGESGVHWQSDITGTSRPGCWFRDDGKQRCLCAPKWKRVDRFDRRIGDDLL